MVHISQAMRDAIGTTTGTRVSHPISLSDIRRWAIAVYYPQRPPSHFVDDEVAPEDFNPFAWSVAQDDIPSVEVDVNDPDRTEILLGIDGPGLAFQLNGGVELEYGVRMRPGDVIAEVTRLASYYEKEGRLGLMLFTIYDVTWHNQRDEFVKLTRQTLVRY